MTSIKAPPPPSPFLLSSSYKLYPRKCSSYTSSVIIYVDTIETVLISLKKTQKTAHIYKRSFGYQKVFRKIGFVLMALV